MTDPSKRRFIGTLCRTILLSALVAPVLSGASASQVPHASSDGLWQPVGADQLGVPVSSQHMLFPSAFRGLSLNVTAFQDLAKDAPLERTPGAIDASPIITLPLPDGSFARFRIQESPIMTPELAAKLPEVRTYRAIGIDDRAATGRLDFTPDGFHGFILSPTGTVFIDPARHGDRQHYISYWQRDDGRNPDHRFHCGYKPRSARVTGQFVAQAASGPTLRTYRLAVAATGEYTVFHGGTVASAQAAIVTTMNRVNGIFEKEVAVRMTLVDNTSIVFTNAATDPYANTDEDLFANQTTIDSQIGPANYDIGHLVGTGGGGVAYLGVICVPGIKALGLTGSYTPVGDSFDVDYVAHEIGHQFGADHTFNGTTSSCGGSREPSDAYEPGSGSTIMAYAGICSAQNLQSHSDPYFHTASYDEIVSYTTVGAGNSCAVQTATGNSAPLVNAGAGFTIPASTPFYLTGSATDPDSDPLTYCWEEFDLGTQSPPDTDNGTRPIFRSFNAVTTPGRTFPRLADLLANTTHIGESLPTTTRTLKFRLTARDNKSGGGVDHALTTISVTAAAGPFAVTAPNTAVVLAAGSTSAVTWNVAGTTAPPVSCATVKVLLSTDGGNTFPTTLLASTPNDGSAAVSWPSTPTTTARMRVECATSPFFDISNVNFTIAPSFGLVATATTTTNVALTWNSVPGAASYDVYRRSPGGGAFAKIGSSVTTSYNDTTAAAGTAYLYALTSVDAGSVASALDFPDLATTVLFTDQPLVSQATAIKALHVSELRTAVDAVRLLAGPGGPAYADPSIVVGSTTVKAIHITELRAALDQARSTLGLPAIAWTDTPLVAQTVATKAVHVDELRNGVK